ncbi:hypothetical protein A2834_02200 [Candidatus Giovannonibacteria bacterium RIFCSPHIGHO2_01_FULL_45_23]|uniref:Uncharacterized protein n=1 Tax=Candidatus Giovannonibacteria bacterium RIFCSPHIGHO2_01_FULL_45_23 TaxID=1798325 RepID=A0A1F5VFC4_9BACT|nr:MAG: hypothetical protein A2834_02200 [Candidatus Giovannonibacteria bacterium RIFCSPHIGHO2_01_FULL_45_23]
MGNIFTKRNICKISISLLGFSFLLIFSLSYAQTAHAQFDFGNFNIWNLGAKIIISPTPGGGLGYNFIEGIGGDLIGTNAFAGITTTAGVVNADIGRVMDDISSDFKSIFGSESSLAIEAVSELYGTDLIPLTFDEILLDPFGSLTSPTVLAVPYEVVEPLFGTDAYFDVGSGIADILTLHGDVEELMTLSAPPEDALQLSWNTDQTIYANALRSEQQPGDFKLKISNTINQMGASVQLFVDSRNVVVLARDRFNAAVAKLMPEALYAWREKAIASGRAVGDTFSAEAVRMAPAAHFIDGVFDSGSKLTLICACGRASEFGGGDRINETGAHEVTHYVIKIMFNSGLGDATLRRIFDIAKTRFPNPVFISHSSSMGAGEFAAEYSAAFTTNPNFRPPLAPRTISGIELGLTQAPEKLFTMTNIRPGDVVDAIRGWLLVNKIIR